MIGVLETAASYGPKSAYESAVKATRQSCLVVSEMQRTFQTLPAVVCRLAAKRALLVQETIRVAWLECALLTGGQPARMLRSRLRIDVTRDL